jgi:hypothetical protein
MAVCRHCWPYGRPGFVPQIVPRPAEDLALPAALRPPAEIVWEPCRECIGGIASCCDGAGCEGSE